MPPRTSVSPHRHPPLVVTSDADLLDDLLRLAAAGGVEVEVAADPAAARTRWRPAPLVLVGNDQAQPCLRARLPRRSRLVLVGMAGDVESGWQVADLLGAEHVAVLPAAEPWLVDRFAECGSEGVPAAGARIVGVVGGRGGAGASILAGGLAVCAARARLRTLLLDADPLGGGLDLVLGWEQLEGLRWPALTGTDGRVDAPALVRALPSRGDLVVLSWDRGDLIAVPAEAMAATLDAARRGRDFVVVDLPRQLDDAAVTALQAADRAFVVVPAELRATAAAARVVATAAPHCRDLSVIVRGPAPGRLRAAEVARALGLPLAGTLRPEPGLCRGLERGEAPAAGGRGPLAELCQRIVTDLTGQPAAGVA
ncbi:helicase/secretion neighborhood CpaE-like protein [Micromonospora phaseoli]|uniref:Helicase/secretion neighborhood CpaE-like protein n=1 Tax=Micromonospora phaseoli TaxID=1144548 RepID=A0A1H7AKV8_9ACTN|nr:septum site-determining protein Ssd [Micromonospora phaseoli]PZV96308.1 secretion/DNA translocation related CpaE-like protein [Micromonospora phaseoli]GIJ75989.1 septum formation initiator [Micromonospora phaseoli]SEJ66229.1 helicase/secretion neighborhood CpaE-like protein [Micromonospora phaseoli]